MKIAEKNQINKKQFSHLVLPHGMLHPRYMNKQKKKKKKSKNNIISENRSPNWK